ncbi:phosphodiesterase [Candidatus Roizmanbacteria bacterium CG10_big_fil_rev_8_21_14_0_10_45_7]|uniref:Phosphodiesterase n=1 Tax=Candidatus Roizmanbacteria bacterium CG10_big_fil_rev_8_21_14_0_10_45_7 TaxID=1974854 RepID=A0A2M8KVR4_9BACT|nr:MAG: phosphodiesterase [Candidatus Roizmanbacteria bacterium CG10_big_fil_rev_8_21_14_0_10_45_7]
MINNRSIKAVSQATYHEQFMRPLYDSYCFSNIPGTIEYLLTGTQNRTLPLDTLGKKTRSNKVLLLFIDSFGWVFFEKYKNRYPFLSRFVKQGTVSKLTSQFPSTTAAHVTNIHTGLTSGESGIYEWTYWEPKIQQLINPLLFSVADGSKGRGTLNALGVKPSDLFPRQTIYQRLKEKGITSHIHQYNMYTPSEYSDVVFDGAIIHPYSSFARGLTELADNINNTSGKQYFFYYYDFIDGAAHLGGPDSPFQLAEIHNTFTMLEDLLYKKIANIEDLTILLTADHGMASVDPATCIYIDQLPTYQKHIKPYLEKHNKKPIAPIGSPRDMFLRISDQHTATVIDHLTPLLKGRVEVVATRTLIEQGFFGSASDEFKAKVGSITLLPYNKNAVWWYGENGEFKLTYHGHHGGLTPQEMQIPFLVL